MDLNAKREEATTNAKFSPRPQMNMHDYYRQGTERERNPLNETNQSSRIEDGNGGGIHNPTDFSDVGRPVSQNSWGKV